MSGTSGTADAIDGTRTQNQAIDDFFYFFLQLRKPRIRTIVDRMTRIYPDKTREQIAERLVESSSNLSLVAGSLLGVPLMLPGVHFVFRFFGLAASSAVVTRMHLYLILEIAHLYGKDIDDPERVPEMVAVVAATQAAVTLPPVAMQVLGATPLLSIAASGLSTTALTQLIGRTAIRYYGEQEASEGRAVRATNGSAVPPPVTAQ